MKINRLLLLLASFYILIINSCGYKPSSYAIKNLLGNNIFVEVMVDSVEPENAPFIKDEMNRIVYTRFKSRIVSKEQSDSQIYISYEGSSFTPLTYKDGYVSRYRANIRVKFNMITKKEKIKKTIFAIVDSDIEESSLSSSALKTEAIKLGLEKALDEFIAYISAKSLI